MAVTEAFKAIPKERAELELMDEPYKVTITLIPSIPWEGEYCEGGVVQLRTSRVELNMSTEKFNQYFNKEKAEVEVYKR